MANTVVKTTPLKHTSDTKTLIAAQPHLAALIPTPTIPDNHPNEAKLIAAVALAADPPTLGMRYDAAQQAALLGTATGWRP